VKHQPEKVRPIRGVLQATAAARNAHWAIVFCHDGTALTAPYQRLISP
jgi:hypothetical protein